jgi:filamentous hemagglutinin family protein
MRIRKCEIDSALISLAIASSLLPLPGLAQSVIPATDGTGTQLTVDGNHITIRGGHLSDNGANLFHGFQQFNLNSSETANFQSSPEIQNIIGRVVGGDPSYINGLLQVTGGNANLYLVNPAGIVFGDRARLDVPASFTATTAEWIGFGDRWFSASGRNDYGELVSNPNQFAFTSAQPGSVINAGTLKVPDGENLVLLGGTVVNTGELIAPAGNTAVVAVPGRNVVRLSQPGMLLNLEIQPVSQVQLPRRGPILSAPRPVPLPALLTGAPSNIATGLRVNPDGSISLINTGETFTPQAGTAVNGGSLNPDNGGRAIIQGDRVLDSPNPKALESSSNLMVPVQGDISDTDQASAPPATVTSLPEETVDTNAEAKIQPLEPVASDSASEEQPIPMAGEVELAKPFTIEEPLTEADTAL